MAQQDRYTELFLEEGSEHIEDLKGFLDEVKKILKQGDIFVVFVPNAGARTTRLFKKYWGWWQVPVHLHHFTPESLAKLLSENGFTTELTLKRGADSLFWLSSLAAFLGIKSEANKLSPFQRTVIKINSFISKYWYFAGDEELVMVVRKQ